jgi:ribonuclease E
MPAAAPVAALTTESPLAPQEDAAGADERRRRRGRRRRGRGGRGEAEGRETTVAESAAEVAAAETVETSSPVEVALEVSPRPEPETIVESAPAEVPAAPVPPPAAEAPIVVPPVAAPVAAPVIAAEPMPVDELRPVLEQAGLTLVQTEPTKLADVLARFANAPKAARVPRERPMLAPLEAGPLVQVETRQGSAPAQH